jgi:ABC-type antimicrobial peptide transport system permease subunit
MTPTSHRPPKLAERLLHYFLRSDLAEEVIGDLEEKFYSDVKHKTVFKAKLIYWHQVLNYLRPFALRKSKASHLNQYDMLQSYFKIGWRNLLHNKMYSLINIGGLALGMTVAMLIGLWVYDELSYNKHQNNYNTVAAVLQNSTEDGKTETWSSQSYQLGPELRESYGNYFKYVVMSSFATSSILAKEQKIVTVTGCFMEEDGPELLSLQMVRGTRTGLKDPSSLLLSASAATIFFGADDPIGKVLKLDNSVDLKVTGVYQDIPDNSSFRGELGFIAPLEVLVNRGGRSFGWGNNWPQVFIQLAENVDMQQASVAIKNAKMKNVDEDDKRFKPELFLHPLFQWHLYSDFNDGVNVGGRIQLVWLFGSIGVFVVLLASINFMNLSTARSLKRSKEVGVRKVIGSGRGQLIRQFFIESLLVVTLAFIFSILLVHLFLPWFNQIASKNIRIDWLNPSLWIALLASALFITLLSGSYPSFYLSAFSPIKVLKGTFRVGRFAALPRKVLVVVQFSVSVILIIGTAVVYQQIQFAKNRPIGYELNGLVTVPIQTQEVKTNYTVLRNDLLASGMIAEVSTSETTVMNLWPSDWRYEWKGKDPNSPGHIYRGAIDYEFGKTIGWKIKEGRDFSRDFPSDSSAFILNEAAVKYMGLENPIGENIRFYGKNFTVIGVVEDMVSQSLYESNKQTVFVLDQFDRASFINIKINPASGASEAIEELNRLFVKHNPNTPFEYKFADDEFGGKFSFEARVGKLVGIFALIAIFVSCLGLFGLASFMAEQRTKEIGVRKVLGASVFNLWKMLSRDFAFLTIMACLLAAPIGYYLMDSWLQQYEYHTKISGWLLAIIGIGLLVLTVVTVSFQAVKAALMNPVNSLKSE